MPFIGLTGNIGAGKTTVLRLFENLGAHTINADRIVHEILKKPQIIKKLSAVLGRKILTKRDSKVLINKKRMADVIFNNLEKRRAAEKIIHPYVLKSAKAIKRKILTKDRNAIIVFEVPLLFEKGYEKIFDKVIVVYCSKSIALQRLRKYGFSEEQALKRMRAQMPISKKKAGADFLIRNNLNISDTNLQVKKIFKKLQIS